MEARLISERNYWKNKYEKEVEANLETLLELKRAEQLTDVYRDQHTKVVLAMAKLIFQSGEPIKKFTFD